jgi:hypothetical protein
MVNSIVGSRKISEKSILGFPGKAEPRVVKNGRPLRRRKCLTKPLVFGARRGVFTSKS